MTVPYTLETFCNPEKVEQPKNTRGDNWSTDESKKRVKKMISHLRKHGETTTGDMIAILSCTHYQLNDVLNTASYIYPVYQDDGMIGILEEL